MTVTSFYFFLLLAVGVLLYYLLPHRIQWVVLTVLSVVFYFAAATPYTMLFLLAATLITYGSTLYISARRTEDGTAPKLVSAVAVSAIFLNTLLWFLLKGSSFWILGSGLIHRAVPAFPILPALPWVGALGMGYYTAQVIGYILDVLWGTAPVQRNPLKLFLFVSFFPQLTVGPISRYQDFSKVYEPHAFSYENICFGTQRILWGLFKKLVIADRVGVIISSIWAESTAGLWPWIAVFLYPLQIYTDFSGCMDIVLGAAELFDIHLAENFKNPFFSRTCQEFWQRWHITLGGWARDYVFYPFMKSRWLVSFSRKTKKKFGKRWGKFLPWCVANAVLWFVMGFWHGSVQHIFGVSLWFWTVLFFSELFQPLCQKITTKFEFKTESFGWHLFQSLRTYIIYALGVVFFSASGLKEALIHYAVLLASLRRPDPWTLFDGTVLSYGATWRDINVLILSVLCLTIADTLREKYTYARLWIKEQSFGLRWCIWLFLFVMVLIFGLYGPTYDASSFIYQGF